MLGRRYRPLDWGMVAFVAGLSGVTGFLTGHVLLQLVSGSMFWWVGVPLTMIETGVIALFGFTRAR